MHQHLIQIQQKYSAFGNPALENAQSVKKLIKFLEIRLNKFQLFVIFHKVYKGKILAHLLDTDVEIRKSIVFKRKTKKSAPSGLV